MKYPPRSRRVDERKGQACQSTRARETDKLAVHTLCKRSLNTRALPRLAGLGPSQRLELRVKCLCVETVLQREGRAFLDHGACGRGEHEGEDGKDGGSGRHCDGYVELEA